jgi:hypothetical protein
MRRREFITLVGSAASTWPFAAHAQQGEGVRRIGVLMARKVDDTQGQKQFAALRQDLRSAAGLKARRFISKRAGRWPTPRRR